MTQAQIIDLLKQNSILIREKYGVVSIGIFGSYARNNFKHESDIDFLVEFKEQKYDFWVSLKMFLEKLLDKPVDIVTTGKHLRKSFLHNVHKEIIYV